MQLVAYGAQDVYLTGAPKITFFQAVYKRHTNFAMEVIQQTVNGSSTSSGRVSVTIARNGDLVGNMYVALTPLATSVPTTTGVAGSVDGVWLAERALADVELSIGGSRIDKHYQTWFRLYAEVFLKESQKIEYGKLTSCPVNTAGVASTSTPKVYLPLLFFFNRNPGLYLPLIALQYHEVRLDFDLSSQYSTYFGTNALEVWANYVYLDTEERRRFASNPHEYLIEQVQHTGGDLVPSNSTENSAALIRLSLNHPVKELIWCYTNTSASVPNAMWNFTTGTSNVQLSTIPTATTSSWAPHAVGAPHLSFTPLSATGAMIVEEGDRVAGSGTVNGVEVGPMHQFKLILNGQDRMKEQLGKFYNQYQPYQHHSGTPYAGIYVYSFALQPEELQPSGTCNFSRIDNAQVAVNLKTGGGALALQSNFNTQKLFAVNYNILRIQAGMGGLAFSN